MRPLYDLKGIIYLIRNRTNGKCYVGQTLGSFVERYHGRNWAKWSNNPHIRSAAAKYGLDGFDISILEHSKTLDELNILEKRYAQEYNSYSPHGYNLVQCGENRRQHPDSVALRSRTIIMNDPSGRDVTITNVRKFCRDKGLHGSILYRVIRGELASHKGWTKQGVTEKHHRNNHRYVIYDSSGRKHEVIGLTDFCRTHGLVYFQMRSMVQGKTQASQGYALSVEAFTKRRCRHIVTLVKEGREIVISNVKQECRQYGLHAKHLYQLLNGKVSSYNGWTMKSLDKAPVHP